MLKLMRKKILQFYAENFCLSKSVNKSSPSVAGKLQCISFHPSVLSSADKLHKQLDSDQAQLNFVSNLGSNFFALMTFVDDSWIFLSGISILFLIHRRQKKDL